MVKNPKRDVLIGGRVRPIALLVDNHDEERAVAAGLLWQAGFSVAEEQSANAARRLLDHGFLPNLIVLKLGIPEAWELWDHRQASRSLREIDVIVLSSFSQPGSVGDAVIIRNPIDAGELLSAIAEISARSTTWPHNRR